MDTLARHVIDFLPLQLHTPLTLQVDVTHW